MTTSDGIIYSVEFSADFGDVPLISEVLGCVNSTISESIKGEPTGNKIQLIIQNATTNLVDLKETATNVSLHLKNMNIHEIN